MSKCPRRMHWALRVARLVLRVTVLHGCCDIAYRQVPEPRTPHSKVIEEFYLHPTERLALKLDIQVDGALSM